MTIQYNLKQPCKECPYTGTTPGWIGPYDSAQVFHDFVKHDVPMPCHMTQDAKVPNHCAGYAIYMNKMCKRSHDRDMRDYQDRIRMIEDLPEVKFSFDGSALVECHGK